MLFLVFASILVYATAQPQDNNRPFPIGTGGQPQQGPGGFNQPGQPFSGSGGPQFGAGQPNPGAGFSGQNPQFGNPSFGSQPQSPVAPQNLGQVPPNNPPPGTVTGADRAVISGNPQWNGNPNGSPWNNNPNQPGQPSNWQQPGQSSFNSGNNPGQGLNQPGGLGNPNQPQNPNQPLWQQQPSTPSTPYPAVQGRPPWAAATTSRPLYWLLSVTVLACFIHMFN